MDIYDGHIRFSDWMSEYHNNTMPYQAGELKRGPSGYLWYQIVPGDSPNGEKYIQVMYNSKSTTKPTPLGKKCKLYPCGDHGHTVRLNILKSQLNVTYVHPETGEKVSDVYQIHALGFPPSETGVYLLDLVNHHKVPFSADKFTVKPVNRMDEEMRGGQCA